MDNIQMRRLYGNDLLSLWQPKCGGTTTTWYSYTSCYTTRCKGDEHHEYGESCDLSGSNRAQQYCSTRWSSFTVNEPPCATIDAGDSPGGGGGSNTGGGSNDDDVIIVPADPNDPENPCGKNSLSDGNGGCIYAGDKDPIDPTLKDPECESVASHHDDVALQAEIDKIKDKIGEPQEYGFRERPDDPQNPNATERFKDLEPFPNNPAKLKITANRRNLHVAHYHPTKFEEDDDGNYKISRLTFSPKDIAIFIGTLYSSSLDPNLDPVRFHLSNYSTTMITERGVFTLKFKGDANDLVALQSRIINQSNSTLRKRRRKYRNQTSIKPEQGLLKHLKYTYGEDALSMFGLFKSNEDGSVEEYKLNENEKLEDPTICHEA